MKDRSIHITREFDAPSSFVFEAFSQPLHIGKWRGPNGFSTTTKIIDFKVSGEWIFTMHSPDGTDSPSPVFYTEIKKPELLKYDHFDGYEDDERPPHFKATITFESLNGKIT
ncbi:MAG: SRPBCC domain-containing protein [Gracilimonas sp.]|uniref:SRPBCC domain-containing protein n=1 Tax=Gracilimonas sp. TaxID=1974203 RepID=UPI003752DE1F|nr:SRPBCC domain-containing protein [Gracilimonas sp.]